METIKDAPIGRAFARSLQVSEKKPEDGNFFGLFSILALLLQSTFMVFIAIFVI